MSPDLVLRARRLAALRVRQAVVVRREAERDRPREPRGQKAGREPAAR